MTNKRYDDPEPSGFRDKIPPTVRTAVGTFEPSEHRRALLVAPPSVAAWRLRRALASQGIPVRRISGTAKALAQLHEGAYGLVFIDAAAQGIDGFALLQSLRQDESTQQVAVCMLMSNPADADVFRGWSNGADWFLRMPVVTEELVTLARRLFGPGEVH